VWEAVVTVRDCSTGATLATLARNNDGTHAAKFGFYRYNSDGTLAGTNVVTSTRTLSVDFNSYSGDTRGEVRDLNGAVIATNCVADAGTRFR
jgi:hypothetical protein